jgi:hypothetical protein
VEDAHGQADLRVAGAHQGRGRGRVQRPGRRTLTPGLIQQQYLARWDGKLPQYAFGGNAVPFVQIPGTSR